MCEIEKFAILFGSSAWLLEFSNQAVREYSFKFNFAIISNLRNSRGSVHTAYLAKTSTKRKATVRFDCLLNVFPLCTQALCYCHLRKYLIELTSAALVAVLARFTPSLCYILFHAYA